MRLTNPWAVEGLPQSQPVQSYKPIWQLAHDNNEKPKVVTRSVAKHDRLFTGC